MNFIAKDKLKLNYSEIIDFVYLNVKHSIMPIDKQRNLNMRINDLFRRNSTEAFIS